MKDLVNNRIDIIIPTYNNVPVLSQCVDSIVTHSTGLPFRFLIVNNGTHWPDVLKSKFPKGTLILETEGNLGWEKGLVAGLDQSDSEYVVFLNDDTFIPPGGRYWLDRMAAVLKNHNDIGVVGPTSNFVLGRQLMFRIIPEKVYYAHILSGFCMMVRREALEKVGGVATDLVGGDDLDLCIRMTQAGYKLAIEASVLVFHHGCLTGNREQRGYWSSREHEDQTNQALIQKHGFKAWASTMNLAIEEVK